MSSIDLNQDIEINDAFRQAVSLLENGTAHILIKGRAGTGKSTFLNHCRAYLKKNMVVLAPTGAAAVNVHGQTIHSFFNFKPNITLKGVAGVSLRPEMKKVYERLETIVIDEVSMVRADLLDCVDVFLRLHGPQKTKDFGGVQMVFIGDLYQLPPVVTSSDGSIFEREYRSAYFFDAHVFKRITVEIVEFEKNYRQKEESFQELLEAIRHNRVNDRHLELLNARYDPAYEPPVGERCVYLTTTNKLADQINNQRLHALKEDLFSHEAKIRGSFADRNLPTHETLDLKVGAQVIMLNNDREGRWVNGTLGVVKDIYNAGFNAVAVQVTLADATTIEVEPYTWEMFEFFYNENKAGVDSRVAGSFKQLPMKLAWAITIHKSQGKTFDKVIIDVGAGGAFCHGQIYVALSRCTTLEGIVLKSKITARDLYLDENIQRFLGPYTRSAIQ